MKREASQVLMAVQNGIPITNEPFRDIGAGIGMSGDQVILLIRELIDDGTIRRFGARIDHLKLGIVANAMVCWNVPAEEVERVGLILSRDSRVTHCYEREIIPGIWEYNLFCVIHGYSRDEVASSVRKLGELAGITDYAILFSRKKFKHVPAAVPAMERGDA